jgi:hypothetical protein
VSTEPARFESSDLFHIPFERRGLVKPQRYSINGLPCLYLAHSAYVCWEELSRPSFASLYLMQCRFREAPKLLNISYVPAFIPDLFALWQANGANCGWLENFIVALVTCWPLIAACSTRSREPSAPFKPEYIVPQLLLQWVTKEADLDGIRYCSTKVGSPRPIPHERIHQRGFYAVDGDQLRAPAVDADQSEDATPNSTMVLSANVVLPVQTLQDTGHCPNLLKLFEVTPVWNCEVALACGHSQRPSPVSGYFEPASGVFMEYGNSQLWCIESILNDCPRRTLP